MKKIITGAALALSAAAMMAAAPALANDLSTTSTVPMVKCEGGNACKGQSACKTASNQCKGQNSCKGKGLSITTTPDDCTKAGGKVITD